MGEAIAAAGGVAAHTRVGELALVIIDEARRINVERFGQATLGHQLAEHFLGSRGAANIAETDEKDGGHVENKSEDKRKRREKKGADQAAESGLRLPVCDNGAAVTAGHRLLIVPVGNRA